MFDPTIIFQRTQGGRDEIQHKSHGLTQSERLVLIMIDGVTAYQGIRSKLPVLSDARFERALAKLLEKELVCEVFLPVEGTAPEEIERTVIDRFLQQDPMDPLTVMIIDPDEHFGDLIAEEPAPRPTPTELPATSSTITAATPLAGLTSSSPASEQERRSAMDEEAIRLADSLAEELRARNAVRPVRVEPIRRIDIESDSRDRQTVQQTRFKLSSIHWGYWLMALGFSFIAGFYLARLSI